MIYDRYQSPLGTIVLAAKDGQLRELHIEGDRYFKAIPDDWVRTIDDPVLVNTKKELDEYFAGKRSAFTIPLAFVGSPFQQQVWQALQQIPNGETVTYAQLAAQIEKPNAVRAVGTAVGRNPLCIIVPCHRVVASSGGLGGYVAGLERKQQLLLLEATKNGYS